MQNFDIGALMRNIDIFIYFGIRTKKIENKVSKISERLLGRREYNEMLSIKNAEPASTSAWKTYFSSIILLW